MPVLLFGIGAFAIVAGLVMVGFGIPINEFSFGNTLIGAGTTATVGGLIIIGLSITVGQLRRIALALADPAHARLALPADDDEANIGARKRTERTELMPAQGTQGGIQATQGAQARASYPPRPMADPFGVEQAPAPLTGAPGEDRPGQSFAPTLRNPDEESLALEDDISLSPQHPQVPPAPRAKPPMMPPPGRPQPANFDAMWPAEAKAGKAPARAPERGPELGTNVGAAVGAPRSEHSRRAEPETPKPRAVAILKSGVVDGMGYTLYVDGSIEAELPQGTLRFASINELRSHLEKNS